MGYIAHIFLRSDRAGISIGEGYLCAFMMFQMLRSFYTRDALPKIIHTPASLAFSGLRLPELHLPKTKRRALTYSTSSTTESESTGGKMILILARPLTSFDSKVPRVVALRAGFGKHREKLLTHVKTFVRKWRSWCVDGGIECEERIKSRNRKKG